jgi:hypothetical protein
MQAKQPNRKIMKNPKNQFVFIGNKQYLYNYYILSKYRFPTHFKIMLLFSENRPE